MKYLLLLVSLVFAPGCASSGGLHVEDARINLKKWGLAYCLSAALPEGAANEDASRAVGGYFERSSHDDEAAYASVRKYFDIAIIEATRASSEGGQPLSLMPCLDAYESRDYDPVIRAQDKYIGK